MSIYLSRLLARRTCHIVVLLVLASGAVHSQENPKNRLAGLLSRYKEGRLADTFYLKGVDSIAPLLFNDDGLVEELSTYRQIAFANKDLGRYRMQYYKYLAVFSINKNNFGAAVYYSKKNNDEAVKVGVFEKGGVPHSELFAISVYQNNQDYPRMIAKYDTLLPEIRKTPGLVAAGKVSGEQGYVVMSIIGAAVSALYKMNDTAQAEAAIYLYARIMTEINKQPEKYRKQMTFYDYAYQLMCYERARHRGQMDSAQAYLEKAIVDVQSPDFIQRLQVSSQVDAWSYAVDFFYDRGRLDSARHYLSKIGAVDDNALGYAGIKQNIILEGESKLLAAAGDYRGAYRMLEKLHAAKDSALHAVNADKDNNLYALAEAENARTELIQTEAKQQRVEKFNFFLILLSSLLAVGGFAGFWIFRSGQRQKMLNLRLGLARNFHDEIGPMLLYANTLVKKEQENGASPRMEELRSQIGYIMEAVRGMSHDLKSNELGTIDRLYRDTNEMLGRISASTGTEFTIKVQDGARVLGHLQYINLRKVIDELVSNSIKHAQCTMIHLNIKTMGRKLLIVYSDNGKGMAPGQRGGIGMQNMQERVNLLNGDFQLHNAYPEGYFIDVTIPLL